MFKDWQSFKGLYQKQEQTMFDDLWRGFTKDIQGLTELKHKPAYFNIQGLTEFEKSKIAQKNLQNLSVFLPFRPLK